MPFIRLSYSLLFNYYSQTKIFGCNEKQSVFKISVYDFIRNLHTCRPFVGDSASPVVRESAFHAEVPEFSTQPVYKGHCAETNDKINVDLVT